MLTIPVVEERPAQAYTYIRFFITIAEIKKPADEGFLALFS